MLKEVLKVRACVKWIKKYRSNKDVNLVIVFPFFIRL